jgi:hypothetical protein
MNLFQMTGTTMAKIRATSILSVTKPKIPNPDVDTVKLDGMGTFMPQGSSNPNSVVIVQVGNSPVIPPSVPTPSAPRVVQGYADSSGVWHFPSNLWGATPAGPMNYLYIWELDSSTGPLTSLGIVPFYATT